MEHPLTVSAKLIAVTQPVEEAPVDNPESLVAFCARVSSNREYEDRGDNYDKLLNYCMRNKHWSIFEMANAVVEVRAPRDISRQLLRHRSFSFQEFSQRYSDEIEFCEREVRLQDNKNRQNSIANDDAGLEQRWNDLIDGTNNECRAEYTNLVGSGVAKECARVILPEGLTMSTLYVNGTLRSWLHYLDVRDDPGVTQHEHVLLAREIRKALAPVFPTVIKEGPDE
ncbi:MAG: FAD-dependent thymidylate synthase [Phormidium sp. SL48-SHIP]|nr:MAG: FAD-dependent thymidylate synthase [Phormidium sp. SL48-SHIP]